MLDWKDARRLAEMDGRPWQVWRPPPREPPPVPAQRPAPIQARERKRQETVARKGAGQPKPVGVDRVVVFTLLAYTLMQVFLGKSDRKEITGKTRQRIWEELLPQGEKISAYVDNRVAHVNATEYSDWLLGVSEGARRRLRGRIRALGRQRRDLPDLPPKP